METDLKPIFDQLKQAYKDDLPKTFSSVFKDTATRLMEGNEFQKLCELLWLFFSDFDNWRYSNKDISSFVYNITEEAIKMVEKDNDKAMTAVLHLITGKQLRHLAFVENHEKLSKEHVEKALADPKFLVSVSLDKYPWIEKKTDYDVFGNNLLAFIALEEWRYDILYDYFKDSDNRMAACLALIRKTTGTFGDYFYDYDDDDDEEEDSDRLTDKEKYDRLMDIVREYADLPVVCEAVEFICNRNMLPKLDDSDFNDELEKENAKADQKCLFISEYTRRFAGSRFADGLKRMLEQMEKRFFETERFDGVVEPEKPFSVQLKTRNISRITLSLYPTDFTSMDKYDRVDLSDEKLKEYRDAHVSQKPFMRKMYELDNSKKHITLRQTLEIDALPLGIYVIEIESDDGHKERNFLHVSGIMAVLEHLPDKRVRIAVLNSTTGLPIPKAKVELMTSQRSILKKWKTLKCDNNGEVFYSKKKQEPDYYVPYTDDDKYAIKESVSFYWGYDYTPERNHEKTEILTDREIYRPGQTIHVACVRYMVDREKKVKPIEGKGTVTLVKEYSKTVSSLKVKFDEFGVAHCDIQIPEDAESGRYQIRCSNRDDAKSIRVEQYKRPSFEVKLEDYKQPYKNGDTIKVEGNACSYAGIPLANAKVKYKVKRQMAWWWNYWSRYWEVEGRYGLHVDRAFYEGEAVTDEGGHFLIDVPMLLEDNNQKQLFRPLFMDIIAEADVVDSTGEVQTASISLPLSNREYYMHIQMENEMELSSQISFTVHTKNATGQNLDMDVQYWIDNSEERVSASSNQPIVLQSLPVGKHELHVSNGEEELKHEFLVFDKYGMEAPCPTKNWTYQSDYEFPENGDEVILQVGCSQPDTYILYNVFSDDKLIECGAEYAESGIINKRITYKKEYGNTVLFSFAWVRDKEMQSEDFIICKPIPERKLKMEWSSFRDCVTPGAEECWKLKIRDMQGRNVTANVIATLYDKSIDELLKDVWSFDDWSGFGPSFRWNEPSTSWKTQYIHKIRLDYSPFFCLEERNCCYCSSAPCGSTPSDSTPKISLRTDMRETAFFMPVLRTDENGEVTIEFRLPDSLTTWKFKAIAHTKDFHYAFFEDETIARKLVMVQPNMPRFVRVGDETNISAKVTNVSGKPVTGKVVRELLNAADGELLFTDFSLISLDDNESKAVTFQFTPDEEVKEYICKIYSVGDGFSDGEQHQLPVLPNKTEVTVTNIITQEDPGTVTIPTAEMFPQSTTRHELSLQYTNHPMWLAVQALPAMTDRKSENAISLAVSLYCNLMTDGLLNAVAEYGQVDMAGEKDLRKSTAWFIKKLKSLQHLSGGFSWYKNMPASVYMTAEVVMHLCRLQTFAALPADLKDLLENAMRFCDREMCSEVSTLKEMESKGEKVYMPTFSMLQHMYNCAVIRRELRPAAKEAYDYLLVLLKNDIHNQTIWEKAMSAVILDYAGHHDRAIAYAESLRQYTRCDDERGRTFDTPRATYSWYSYKIPTHVSGMEALHLLFPDDKVTLREMQKWLLYEKRTQMWDTPIDSVNAVHALLLDAHEMMAAREPSLFFADGVQVDTGTKGNEGYVDTALPSTTGKLSIEKPSEGISWGAVFASFLQPMADVEASSSGMSIKRELITDKDELHVGDRIRVRLTYHCDRDFDFVTVTDSKAACMEPVNQLSWSDSFKHVVPLDTEIRYAYYGLAEGTYSIETEYYLTRPGTYEFGIATIVCTYAPEFRATCPSQKLVVK